MRRRWTIAKSFAFAVLAATMIAAWAQPSARGFAEMAYDSESDLFVLYGGLVGPFDRQGSVIGGTWVFDPSTGEWSERTPAQAPPELLAANLVYDKGSDLVVLWGGADAEFSANTDVWTYDVDSDVWTRLDIDPATGPEHRAGSRMAYDESQDVVVLFGGQDTTDGSFPTTTWLLDIDVPSWRQVETMEAPRGRFYYGFAYEPTSESVYLWGGGAPILNTLWSFDTERGVWEEIETSGTAPFPQGQVGMVAVPELGGLLTFGGESQGNDRMWLFDLEQGEWNDLGALPLVVRNRFALAHAPGYGTLVFGGQIGDRSFAFSDGTYLYDPVERAWRVP